MTMTRRTILMGAGALASRCAAPALAREQATVPAERFQALVAAYPDHLSGIEREMLIWTDGTRMPLGEDIERPFETMLRSGTMTDQLRQGYRAGRAVGTPPKDWSPGRIRHAPFFAKMYGDCQRGAVAGRLKPVAWMPKSGAQTVPVTTVNGVDQRMARIVAQLETLPDRLKAYLVPSGGTYNCRVVADTGQPSMHASGAAIDISTAMTDYWFWARGKGGGAIPYRNRIPFEIVEIFEAEKFIWGGKWYHYDTMHFEYRPEMFV